jgi:formiminoglutamate deiminase
MAAAAESGIRLTLLDTLYLSAGFGEPLSAEQLRFSDGSADQWLARMETYSSASTKIGAAIHSVRAVDPRSMESAVNWAQEHDAPLHVHVSEQKKENLECTRHYGKSPVAVLANAGVWSARSTAVHATHLTAADITTLGESRAFICLCPSTEADLADGIGPATALHRAGARLTIGSDENVLTDPFAEATAIEMHQRLATGQREIFTPSEIVSFMSENGYQSLGWDEGGILRVGALADFVTLDTQKLRYSGVNRDRIPLHATAVDVIRTIVAGRCVYSADDASPSPADTFTQILNSVRSSKC